MSRSFVLCSFLRIPTVFARSTLVSPMAYVLVGCRGLQPWACNRFAWFFSFSSPFFVVKMIGCHSSFFGLNTGCFKSTSPLPVTTALTGLRFPFVKRSCRSLSLGYQVTVGFLLGFRHLPRRRRPWPNRTG